MSDVWLSRAREAGWEARAARLPERLQVSLAAACAARTLPIYLTWAADHHPEGADLARHALDALWRWVRTGAGDDLPGLAQRMTEEIQEAVIQVAPGEHGIFQAAEALCLALRTAEPERRQSALVECLFDAFWAVGKQVAAQRLGESWVGPKAAYDAVVAASARAQAELDFQEAALQELESAGKPMTLERAAHLSQEYREAGGEAAGEQVDADTVSLVRHQPPRELDHSRPDDETRALEAWVRGLARSTTRNLRDFCHSCFPADWQLRYGTPEQAVASCARDDPVRARRALRELDVLLAVNPPEDLIGETIWSELDCPYAPADAGERYTEWLRWLRQHLAAGIQAEQ